MRIKHLLCSLLLLAAFCWRPAEAFSSGTPVENTGFSSASPTLVIPSVPASAAILVAVTWNPGGGTITLTGVSDSTSSGPGTYTQVASTVVTGGSVNGATFLLTNATAGTHTITVTFSGGTGGDIFGVWISGPAALDVAHGQETNFPGTGANAVSGGSVTTTTNGDLIVGVMLTDSGTPVLSAGTSPNAFTSLGLVATVNMLETFTQTTAGAIAATATQSTNGDQVAFTIALKPLTPAPYVFTQSTAHTLQTPVTGFTQAPAAGLTELILNPAGTLATGTVTLPANPGDTQPFALMTSQTITALTVNTSDGSSINGAPTTLSANTAVRFYFVKSLNAWFRD